MNKGKNIFIYIISFILVMSTVGLANAEVVFADTQVKGIVTSVKGSVYVKRQGSEKKTTIYKNMSVVQGDTLITDAKSSLTLKINAKEVTLGENTKIVIDELWGNEKAEGTSISLIFGTILNVIKDKLNINSKNEIKTPTTIIGVRGTKFVSAYQQSAGTQVAVLEGSVYAVPAGGSTQPDSDADVLTYGSDAGAYALDFSQIDKGILEAIVSGGYDKDIIEQASKALNEINAAEQKAEEERLQAVKEEQEKLSAQSDEDNQSTDNEGIYIPPVIVEDDDEEDPDNENEIVKTYIFAGGEIVVNQKRVFWNDIKEDVIEGCTEIPDNIKRIILIRKLAYFTNIRAGSSVEYIGNIGLKLNDDEPTATVDISLEFKIKNKDYIVTIKDVNIKYAGCDDNEL